MAKKKKSGHKKHSFAPTASKTVSTASYEASHAASAMPGSRTASSAASSAGMAMIHPDTYRDVVRSLGLAAALAIIQILLWLLFAHTTLGSHVYGLVRV